MPHNYKGKNTVYRSIFTRLTGPLWIMFHPLPWFSSHHNHLRTLADKMTRKVTIHGALYYWRAHTFPALRPLHMGSEGKLSDCSSCGRHCPWPRRDTCQPFLGTTHTTLLYHLCTQAPWCFTSWNSRGHNAARMPCLRQTDALSVAYFLFHRLKRYTGVKPYAHERHVSAQGIVLRDSTHTANTQETTHFLRVQQLSISKQKIAQASESTLGQSDFYPFASQRLSRLWLDLHGFEAQQLKAKAKKATQIFLMLWRPSQATWLTGKKYCSPTNSTATTLVCKTLKSFAH